MHTAAMSLTLDQIVAEARLLPREQTAELFDRLLAETIDTPDPEIEQAWKIETRRRIAEIENGTEPGVPGEQAMVELRRIVGR
jgi:hypothetical protein